MSHINKHGLSRTIPKDIKRTIRQRDGFGCVVCGLAIVQYEHVDPEFKDATAHNPDCITLLCGACHDKVTRGIWSKGKIKEHMKAPKCKQAGFTYEAFDIGNKFPIIKLGELTFEKTSVLIEAMNEKILTIDIPEVESGPYRLSGIFCDKSGNKILEIKDNEWFGEVANWDIETIGKSLFIKDSDENIILHIIVNPPNNLIIQELNMNYNGALISGENGNHVTFQAPSGATLTGFDMLVQARVCGVRIDETGIKFGVNG
jgi:hypothetical protein